MSDGMKKTILIVDDDADIRATIRIVLEAAGFSVGEAANAEEGAKIAQRISPDAVIVDLMMESVDAGSRLSRSLKEGGCTARSTSSARRATPCASTSTPASWDWPASSRSRSSTNCW